MFWFTEIKITTQKGVNPKCISHQKLLLRILDIVINAKNFYDEYTDSDIKQYKEIRNLITGQGRQRD